MKTIILAGLLTFSYASYAAKGDCKTERKAYCGQCKKGDKSCFKACMKENKDKLSEKCKTHRKARKQSKNK